MTLTFIINLKTNNLLFDLFAICLNIYLAQTQKKFHQIYFWNLINSSN